MKTSELIGPALDWAVAKCEGVALVLAPFPGAKNFVILGQNMKPTAYEYTPNKSWAQGGPIIEREGITLRTNVCIPNHWAAFLDFGSSNTNVKARRSGPTPLIAAMRCYVTSKLGEDIEIPEELL